MHRRALFAAVVLSALPASAQTYIVGNEAVARHLRVEDGRLRTEAVENRRTGTHVTLDGPAFALEVVSPEVFITPPASNVVTLTSEAFVLDSVRANGERALTAWLHAEAAPIHAVLRIAADDRQPVVTTTLTWSQPNATDAPYLVRVVTLEDAALGGTTATGGGYGQPVFTEDLFFGIEYPGSDASADGSRLRLAYDVGLNATVEGMTSYPAVVGAGGAEAVRHDFVAYINSLRPNPVRPYLLYNSWYDIRDFNEPEIFDRIAFFRQTLGDAYGQPLDAFVLDDGWDDLDGPLWSIDLDKLPSGLESTGERLDAAGAALGLWASPWGGYDDNRKARARTADLEGYETMGEFLCLAGTRYHDRFRDQLLHLQRENNVGFWKLDGFLSTCNRPDHGHEIGRFSRRAQIDAFLGVLDTLRADRPDVHIDVTVGTWPSPWWLKWADYVWMGGADYAFSEDVPSLTLRDQSVTYRDEVMYDNLVVQRQAMPTSAFMTHGIIKGRLNRLGEPDERPEALIRDAVVYFSRGVAMWELYLTPEIISDPEWAGVVQVMEWARANWDLLEHTTFVGGSPRGGEVYGYAHFDGDRGLLTLRNPSPEARSYAIPLDASVGVIDEGARWHVARQYPTAEALADVFGVGEMFAGTLAPYEVAVFAFEPTPPSVAVVGAPYRVVEGGVEVFPTGTACEVRLGGVPASVACPPSEAAAALAPARLAWETRGEGSRGDLRLTVPRGFSEPEASLLIETATPTDSLVAHAGRQPLAARQESPTRWWVRVPLQTGRNQIDLRLDGAEVASARLLLTAAPEVRPVRLALPSGATPDEPPGLPVAWEGHRIVVPVPLAD